MRSLVPASALLVLALGTSTACGGGGDTLDLDAESRRTISVGVYGFFVSGCDTEDCTATVTPGVGLAALIGVPPADTPTDAHRGITVSDADGFFELALDPGPVTLARGEPDGDKFAPYEPYLAIELPASAPVRVDFIFGPDGGHWGTGGLDAP